MNEFYCIQCSKHRRGEPAMIRLSRKWCSDCLDAYNVRMAEIKRERRALGIAQTEPINGVRHEAV